MQRIIGIDFGTSTTYMNIKRYNGTQPDGDKFSYIPVMFNYGESSGYVATIVRENADGSFDFGEKASEPLEGSRIHTEVKMRLESTDEQERAEARRITREFFKFLHAQYAQQTSNLGSAGDQEETVISYPVKWQKETAQFMLDAARDAGFQNVRGMDEAEAAVATVLCQNSGGMGLIYADKPGYLMLIDMGAGTTDLVVCRYQASANGEIAIELVTSWPHSADEPTFGGREIDKVLEQYVEDHLTKSLLPALAPQASVIATAPGQAKMWKERNVSVTLAADKQVNTCAYIGTYKTMGMLTGDFPAFGRREFESFAESGLRDYAHLISGCLEKTAEADENFSALDLVILTGGHSAWYFAKEILTGGMTGWLDHPALAAVRGNTHRVVSLPNPQTTVSLGLVYSKLPFRLAKHAEPKKTVDSEPAPQNETSVPVEMPMQTDDISIVILPFDAKAMITSMDIQAYLVMSEIGTDDTVTIDNRDLPLGQRIRTAEAEKDCYVLVVTEAEPSSWLLSVRRFGKDIGVMDINQFEEMYRSEMPQQKAVKQTPVEYTWDPQLVPVIKHFIQEAPAFARQNELRSRSLVAQMSNAFQLGATEEIFYAKHWGNVATHRKPWGMLITSAGIHVNAGTERFMTWWEFLNSHLEYGKDAQMMQNRIVISGKGVKVSFLGDQADSIGELHDLLCERAANLQKAAASKQTAKAAQPTQPVKPTTQTFQTVENESFDAAMKRFNRQVKDAQRQQKASVKPAQPARAATQPSNRNYYKWDDRLLPIIEEFIRQEPALRKRNELYQRMSVVANLRRSFKLPANDIVYYATPFGAFESTRRKGELGYIFAASGLWKRDKVWRTIQETHYTWEMFLNSEIQLEYGSKHIYSENFICGALTLEIINPEMINNPGGEMSRLQTLLREKSVALEEGRPI